ncbi:PLP-dependent transferase [Hyaloscypha hepaticicola]|uniref:PLP-dependent transferase n=1 Tax=Hyaloscypha hepaticicola TaxID=2082293 RepID=A0A2J6QP19_9HELO|nr:PLP-dependent transferase [Hyaloscypha hepaticicola]
MAPSQQNQKQGRRRQHGVPSDEKRSLLREMRKAKKAKGKGKGKEKEGAAAPGSIKKKGEHKKKSRSFKKWVTTKKMVKREEKWEGEAWLRRFNRYQNVRRWGVAREWELEEGEREGMGWSDEEGGVETEEEVEAVEEWWESEGDDEGGMDWEGDGGGEGDVVVSSLTKIFSGDCNVMGGSAILNLEGRYYQRLKSAFEADYEEKNYWVEDILFMERNSRDFVPRIERINHNAEAICNVLQAHPLVKEVYYPKYSPTKQFYEDCRIPTGGYGGLLSFTFHKKDQAVAFYDRIETAKGPSLCTNFTLTSPYVILSHYLELNWAAGFGVPADLLRISVGLEDTEDLKSRFAIALRAAEAVGS